MELLPEIAEFYNEGKEAQRLLQGLGRFEFLRMQEILRRYLRSPPAEVVDIGGGPGAYACWLAACGYSVHLVDPVPLHVDQASQASSQQPDHPIASCAVGDARQLPFGDGTADAAFLHGPLYHLPAREDRLLALREARRVVRPGGVVFAVAISNYASTIVGLLNGWIWNEEYVAMIREEIETGLHRRPPNWQVLTTAFFHHPHVLAEELTSAGFHHQTTLGVQGPVWMVPNFESSLEDESKSNILLQLARLVEHEPVHSPHMVAVARRP